MAITYYAAENGNLCLLTKLLDRGFDVNDRDRENGMTLLSLSCYNGHVECARVLIERGADIDSGDDSQWTALHYAVYGDHVECTRLLLECGANRDIADCRGRKPIDLYSKDNQEIGDLLLGGGCATKAAKPRSKIN